jgi:hypothetical protein
MGGLVRIATCPSPVEAVRGVMPARLLSCSVPYSMELLRAARRERAMRSGSGPVEEEGVGEEEVETPREERSWARSDEGERREGGPSMTA